MLKFPLLLMAAVVVLLLPAQAQIITQTLRLKEGWNAIPLRVTPDSPLSQIFAGTPVEVVSTWYPERQKVLSLQDPAAEPWKSTEWRTWQAGGRAGAFLNNLHSLESGRAYLIKASTATTIQVRGSAVFDRLAWQAQSFNLTGLPADPAAPATVAGFFGASPAHQPLRVFKLNAGKWQAVPGSAAIDPETAYWIWCGEGSDFQGPLDVRVSGRLVLGNTSDSATVGLISASNVPLAVRVTATGSLPLTGVTRERLTGTAPVSINSTPQSFTANPVEPLQYRFALAAGAAPTAGASTLLEFRAAGVRLVVPVTAAP